jgi:hypothetical protein
MAVGAGDIARAEVRQAAVGEPPRLNVEEAVVMAFQKGPSRSCGEPRPTLVGVNLSLGSAHERHYRLIRAKP